MVDIGTFYTKLLWKSEYSELHTVESERMRWAMNIARIFEMHNTISSVNLKERSRFDYIVFISIWTPECILEKYCVTFGIELNCLRTELSLDWDRAKFRPRDTGTEAVFLSLHFSPSFYISLALSRSSSNIESFSHHINPFLITRTGSTEFHPADVNYRRNSAVHIRQLL
jgi:hypothetical protein